MDGPCQRERRVKNIVLLAAGTILLGTLRRRDVRDVRAIEKGRVSLLTPASSSAS